MSQSPLVTYIGHFSANPDQTHWEAAWRVLRYLSDTCDYTLMLGHSNTYHDAFVLTGCLSDSDWKRDDQ